MQVNGPLGKHQMINSTFSISFLKCSAFANIDPDIRWLHLLHLKPWSSSHCHRGQVSDSLRSFQKLELFVACNLNLSKQSNSLGYPLHSLALIFCNIVNVGAES